MAEPEKTSVVRLVLFAVLAVMIVALIYEYGLVRPSYKSAENAVDDFVERRGNGDPPATPEVVQSRIGKSPVGGLQDKGDYLLEHYQWTRWLPWKTYDIYVVYEPGDPPMLFNTTRPNPPGPGETPYAGVALDPALADSLNTGFVSPPGFPGPPPTFPGDPAARRPGLEEDGPNQHGEGASAEANAEEPPADASAAEADKSEAESADKPGEASEKPQNSDSETPAPQAEPDSQPSENE